MAPSLTETVSNATEQIHDKVVSKPLVVKSDNTEAKEEAPAVQPPSTQNFTKREPLKLSGALDHFESFDVTPIIGREFVGVNLAKWLRAPNSDELIRDLAITSKIPQSSTPVEENRLIAYQFLSAVLCSSESKTISPMSSKKS
jgi:hypothetical protein